MVTQKPSGFRYHLLTPYGLHLTALRRGLNPETRSPVGCGEVRTASFEKLNCINTKYD